MCSRPPMPIAWCGGWRLALSAPVGGGRRRSALGRGQKYWRKLRPLRRRTGPARRGRTDRAARAEAARRDATAEIVGHGDRGLAARSLYDLREIYFAAPSARPRRHDTFGGRLRYRDPYRAPRIHAKSRRRTSATA